MKTEIIDESELQLSATLHPEIILHGRVFLAFLTAWFSIFGSHCSDVLTISSTSRLLLDHSSSGLFSLFWGAFQPSFPSVIEICLIFLYWSWSPQGLLPLFRMFWGWSTHLQRREIHSCCFWWRWVRFAVGGVWVQIRCIHFNVFVSSCWFVGF